MPMLDIFNSKAFSMASLTTAINKLPYVPGRLGQKGIFKHVGVTTTIVAIEYSKGKITLIPSKTRGSGSTTKGVSAHRDLIPFVIPHLPYDDEVLADSVQGVRAFGEESALETVTGRVNEKMAHLRQSHEITHEYHRIGALQGHIKDADGSTTIHNLFTAFNISETTVDFNLDSTSTDVKAVITGVRRTIEDKLGGVPFTGIACECGNAFWDAFINHDAVKAAFDRWQDGAFLRSDQRVGDKDFEFCDVMWHNYRGSVGDVAFINTDHARFYPVGVPELFVHYSAPADFIETVNTVGKPVYVKQERMKFDKGVELHSQSNPAMICTRPEVLIKGTRT